MVCFFWNGKSMGRYGRRTLSIGTFCQSHQQSSYCSPSRRYWFVEYFELQRRKNIWQYPQLGCFDNIHASNILVFILIRINRLILNLYLIRLGGIDWFIEINWNRTEWICWPFSWRTYLCLCRWNVYHWTDYFNLSIESSLYFGK